MGGYIASLLRETAEHIVATNRRLAVRRATWSRLSAGQARSPITRPMRSSRGAR